MNISSLTRPAILSHSVAPNGNVLYYGDIFGKIVALQVASFETSAPTVSPTATPSTMPSAAPSFSAMPSSHPTSYPTRIETSDPSGGPTSMPVPFVSSAPTDRTVPTTEGPTSDDLPSAFDARFVNAAQDDVSESSSSLLAIILGAGCGFLFLAATAFFVVGRRRRQDEKKRGDIVIVQEVPFYDLEDPEELGGDENSDDGNSLLAIEVIGGSTVYSPKKKKRKSKRKKKKPLTPSTLESIEEAPEAFDESHTPDNYPVVLVGEDGDDYSDVGSQEGDDGSVQNLNDKFSQFAGVHSYFAEIQTQPDSSPPQSPDRSAPLSQGAVGVANGGTHLESSAGDNQDSNPVSAQAALQDLPSDLDSVGSQQGDDGSVQKLNDKFSYFAGVHTYFAEIQTQPEPSPPQSPDRSAPLSQGSVGAANGGTHLELSVGNNQDFNPVSAQAALPRQDLPSDSDSDYTETDTSSNDDTEEEKKADDETVRASSGRPPHSPQSNPPLSPSSAALRAPVSQSSPASSTDSDMYLDETNSLTSSLSPSSTHIFGRSEAEDVPDDEVRPPGAHLMLQPSLNHKNRSDDSTASDEFAAPGGRYIKGIPDTVPVSSSKYGQSVRQKKERSFPTTSSVHSHSTPKGYSEWQNSDSSEDGRKTSTPTFKRRSKLEEQLAKEATPDEDMPKDEWDAFMKDLEATEKQFYTPEKAAPPSNLLSYYDSDSESESIPPLAPKTRDQ